MTWDGTINGFSSNRLNIIQLLNSLSIPIFAAKTVYGLSSGFAASENVDPTSLADDIKYSSSPDLIGHKGRYVYVYNKFEHLYGRRGDPGKLYGCFIGAITPTGRGR